VRGAVAVDTAPIIVNELTLMGSRRGRFEAELCVLGHPLVRVEDLIAARFPLSEAPQAFAHAAERGVLKVLLELPGSNSPRRVQGAGLSQSRDSPSPGRMMTHRARER
jgi:hypothetical protein